MHKDLDDMSPEEDVAFEFKANDDLAYFLQAIPNVITGDTTGGQYIKLRTSSLNEFSIHAWGEMIFELQWMLHMDKQRHPELNHSKMIVSDLKLTPKIKTPDFCPRRGFMLKILYTE